MLGRLNSAGSPRLALLVSAGAIPLAFVMEHWARQSAFLYIIGASLFAGLLSWLIALAAHIAFRRRISPEQLAALPMRSPGGAVLSALGFTGITAAVISTWWVPQSRITILSGLPALVLLTLGYLFARKRWLSSKISE
jgi:L-asparagine transporter-like permease